MTKQTIAVLGAGAWGSALALVLARNGHEVRLWEFDEALYRYLLSHREAKWLPGQPFPDNLIPMHDLAATLNEADATLLVVPSHVLALTLEAMKPHWTPGRGLAWATKGLAPPDQLLSEVVTRVLGESPQAVITGPTFAYEVAKGMPSAVLVASQNDEFAQTWKSLFSCSDFYVELGQDIMGAQIAGVVKNVLAVAVGMSDGLGFGANTRAAIMTRGLQEMMALGESMGAQASTFLSVAGVGDLILTCTDNQSRNRRFGLALGEGKTLAEAEKAVGLLVEGYHNTQSLYRLMKKQHLDLPIIEKMYAVLSEQCPPREAIQAWWRHSN